MFLERETYNLDIVLTRSFSFFWKKFTRRKSTIKVQYLECNIRDLMIFIGKSKRPKFSLDERILSFVEEHSSTKLRKRQRETLLVKNYSVRTTLLSSYFDWCFEKKPEVKKENDWELNLSSQHLDTAPLEANMAFIAKETSTSIIDLYEKCTIKDVAYLSDAVEWNINLMDKKSGKAKNRAINLRRKSRERTPEEMADLKKRLARIPDSWKTIHEKVVTKM